MLADLRLHKEFSMRRFTVRQVMVCALLVPALTAVAGAQGRLDGKPVAEHAHADAAPASHAAAVLVPVKSSGVSGTIHFTQEDGTLLVTGTIIGLAPGLHGFHVHQFGDLSDLSTEKAGEAAGSHYDPHGHKHGGPETAERHAGDLGNIKAADSGEADIQIKAPWLRLSEIVGRSIVVHGKADDLKSQPSGDSGPRIGIGVIGLIKSPEAKPAP
jgi:Cu-Zn family superoxide dismutase